MVLDARHKPYTFAGGRIYLDVDHSPAMRLRAEGRYEPDRVALLQRFLAPGMTFVDVGANMGDFSLIAAKLMHDEGRVLAFEPWPANCHWMRRSIELNGYRCIELMELALSDVSGEEDLYIGAGVARHSLLPRPREHQETLGVKVDTLDAVLEASGDPQVDLVKIDVEGAELKVLRGAARTLGRAAPMKVMIDVHAGRIDPREVWSLLTEYGFSVRLTTDPDTETSYSPDPGAVLAVKD